MKLSNKVYDILKYISIIAIPAVVVLISSISAAVGVDATTVCAIIGAVGVFIGSLIGVSSNAYKKQNDIEKTEGGISNGTR